MDVQLKNLKKGSVAASHVEMTQVVLPAFANSVGTVFGGQIMSWIDICAAVSAQRHARSPVVTASIDSVNFMEPIRQGYVVVLKSQVNAAFNSSMEIGVNVWAENPLTGDCRHAMEAFCTFVSLDLQGVPKGVPNLLCETEAERDIEAEAQKRRAHRLSLRKR